MQKIKIKAKFNKTTGFNFVIYHVNVDIPVDSTLFAIQTTPSCKGFQRDQSYGLVYKQN